jgi:hypothetical protein
LTGADSRLRLFSWQVAAAGRLPGQERSAVPELEPQTRRSLAWRPPEGPRNHESRPESPDSSPGASVLQGSDSDQCGLTAFGGKKTGDQRGSGTLGIYGPRCVLSTA